MSFVRSKWGRIAVSLGALLVLSGSYGLYSLFSQRNALQAEVAGLNSKVVQLKNKYAEQKAMAEAMLRAKLAAESGNRLAESLKQENEELQGRLEEEKRKSAQETAKHGMQMAEAKEHLDQQRSAFDKLREESSKAIQEKNQKITALTSERDALTVSLKQETAQHGRCRKDNARLADISTELVKKYKDKGVIGSIVSNEPLTQLKKVEQEKLCQEYLDNIDKDTL